MGKPTAKRIFAFIIDMIIVSIIATAFSSIKYLNPNIEEEEKLQNEYVEYVLSNPTIDLNDKKIVDMSYDLSRLGLYSSVITLVVSFLYFSFFQYYTGGKTAGKLLMGIQVISTDSENLRLTQVIMRSSIVDSIFTSALLCMAMLFLDKASYLSASNVVQIIDLGLVLLCIGMAIYREDGVGLHDMFAHTKVVRKDDVEYELNKQKEIKEAVVKEKEIKEEKEEVKEIEIEEKPVNSKKTSSKKTTKKKTVKKSQSKKEMK